MDAKDLKKHLIELRFRNFQELLRVKYSNSPQEFCDQTHYDSPTTISQLKTKKKSFGADLARELELVAGLQRYELESETGLGEVHRQAATPRQPKDWPFSIPLDTVLALNGPSRRNLDDTVVKMVLGSQAQEILDKQRRRKHEK